MLNRTKVSSLSFIVLIGVCLAAYHAQAHTDGHGPSIAGKGPHGGTLVAIVAARDADLGEHAKANAIAEWVRRDQSIGVHFLDVSKKTTIEISAGGEIKWILLGPKLSQPVIIKGSFAKAAHFITGNFDPKVLSQAQRVEVILPNLGKNPEKHVFIISLDSR